MARKVKQTNEVKETPIVFFLKIPEDSVEYIEPVDEITEYSDILTGVDNSASSTRFTNDILLPMLNNIQYTTKYSEHVYCFWCCHGFQGNMFTCPISYDTYKNVYICDGAYCSPECALSNLYTDPNISDNTRWNRHALLQQLYSPLYKNSVISPAPPRTMLRIFGGPLDIKQFREYISSTNDIILSELPPIRMIFPSMNIQGPLRDIKKFVSLSNETCDKASESLRLKRTTPVHTNLLTLDMCIKR